MKQAFNITAIRGLKRELNLTHKGVKSDIKDAIDNQEFSIDHYAIHNLLNAHSCYTDVLNRVAENLSAKVQCSDTDLELLEIRKVYYARQVDEFYRCRKNFGLCS